MTLARNQLRVKNPHLSYGHRRRQQESDIRPAEGNISFNEATTSPDSIDLGVTLDSGLNSAYTLRWGRATQEHFTRLVAEVPGIEVDPKIQGGAPVIRGTRIPVYMILDSIEMYGSLIQAQKSYPTLTTEQIKDAVYFARLVLESPVVVAPSTATL